MLDQSRRLPWYVALIAFAVYLATMGHGMTANNLPLVAKVAGWSQTPLLGQPLVWLCTLPLCLLPVAWVPLMLKLMGAVLGAAVLGLLTRTLQMLPWDHPWPTANRFAFLVPVVTAGAICGLEFGFWQESTSSFAELLDLLLLATAAWLLLEYHVRLQPRWLDAAALVWGIGMAENWVMLLTLPLFVAGLIWVQRLSFFQWRFILRMVLLGLAGFSLYALLPMVIGLTPHSPMGLKQTWLATVHQTKTVFTLIYYGFWRGHRMLTIAMVIYFLVPTLPLLVHMRDEGTHNKPGVDQFQIWLYRALRIGLLLACVWLAFDPVVGPQQLIQRQLGLSLPMLTLNYVIAIGAAFLVGNLLLISQIVVQDYYHPRQPSPWRQIAVPVYAVGVALVVGGLLVRNAPAVVRSNFHSVEELGQQAVNDLPPGGGVVLSDVPQKLMIFEAALAHRKDAGNWLPVDTHALPNVEYRARLEARRPAGWLTDQTRHELTPTETALLLKQVAGANRLYYLHPSYGNFFEVFYLTPKGTIYEMHARDKDPMHIPPLSDAFIAANEQFWTGFWDKELAQLVPPPAHRSSGLKRRIERWGITPAPRTQDRFATEWYSMDLDGWGVALQKQGHLREAKVRLEQAAQLNTNNLSARITLACNTNLQTGVKMGLADVARLANQLGNPARINAVLNSGGPFDEPTTSFLLGSVFMDSGLLIQAAEQFERVRQLAPGSLPPELALAETYNRLQMPERGRPLINHLLEEAKKMHDNASLDLDLALLDSYAWLLETNRSNARNALATVVEEHPADEQIRNRIVNAYLALGDITNALKLIDSQIAKAPDDASALNSKAVILIQAGRGGEAIAILNQVLMLTNLPAARINRVYAQLARQNFDAAETDLRELEKTTNAPGMVAFGLAAVADHRHDTNQMARYLRQCLTNTQPGSTFWKQASARLQAIDATAAK